MSEQRIPNFYCIGAQKAGTTTLHEILKQHPDIYLPKSKEAHFFQKDDLYDKGLSWYLNKFFSEAGEEKIVGSVTPGYLSSDTAIERIYKSIGENIKFIAILRNPVDRAFSHYKMNKFRGLETLSFEEAILKENQRIKKNSEYSRWYNYIGRGYYYEHLKRFFKYYPGDQLMLINFEKEFIRNTDETITRILDFLDIQKLHLKTEIQANVSKKAHFPIVNRILMYKPSLLEKITGFIPKRIKTPVRSFLENKNAKEINGDYSLDEDLKKELIKRFYIDDIKNLEKHFNFATDWISN